MGVTDDDLRGVGLLAEVDASHARVKDLVAQLDAEGEHAASSVDALAEDLGRVRADAADAARAASDALTASEADRRRVETFVRHASADVRATLDARLDDARRDVATRLRVIEEATEEARISRERMAWWGAAEALWVQVSAFVATPIIDFREAVWQLARAASSAAKFW
jgi:hypothetical protein